MNPRGDNGQQDENGDLSDNDQDGGEEEFGMDDDEQGDYDEDERLNAGLYGPVSSSESAEIIAKKYMERDQLRMAMELEERERRLAKQRYRQRHIQKWQQKTAKSPFHVNLVAENERLDEENRLRMTEDARRARELAKRADKAKQEVILKAITETSDLELLRREKRAIIDEERRLKALMDLEKTNSHRKMDLIAAKNAEKKRRQEKEEYRRKQRQQELEFREQRYKQLLKEKLALEGQ
ncbi:hypothetical protein Poli38472_001181 [Pythium oligandrum]|uniref:Uncharacterized protein n=1 Tax=Pythium oligandrum TaxID=41045 RepID=A0A8K1CSZ6_PYTOL|nr:hypothetical protein Poli38472_001181 [Pythium oligandrum]|eukprot:TMW69025.1 hypothetical protein Poli38472_001181 [Pythium oligandrum]